MAGILGKGLEWWAGAVIGYFLLGHFVSKIVGDVIGAAQETVGSMRARRTYIGSYYR